MSENSNECKYVWGYKVFVDSVLITTSNTLYPTSEEVYKEMEGTILDICAEIADDVEDFEFDWDDEKSIEEQSGSTWHNFWNVAAELGMGDPPNDSFTGKGTECIKNHDIDIFVVKFRVTDKWDGKPKDSDLNWRNQ